MNFFKSVFTDDPDPDPPSSPPQTLQPESPSGSNPTWSFGGLIKTLQVKSDWIDTYRRDLHEFGSGLKKETEILKDVASRAVLEFPDSIDVGASRAQLSLQSVGQAIDSIGSSVWKSTAEILLQNHDQDLPDSSSSSTKSLKLGRYNRFDVQLRGIQCDVNTYVGQVEDVGDYERWKLGFDLGEKGGEIEGLMKENGSVEEIYNRVVPSVVDHEVFWCRYYYRVYKLNEAESVRAKLVKRAISRDDEEEDLSWDVDDDEEGEDSSNVGRKEGHLVVENSVEEESRAVDTEVAERVEGEEKSEYVSNERLEGEEKSEDVSNEGVETEEKRVEGSDDKSMRKPEEKVPSESRKDSDISGVSTQVSAEEDDMGWDEIEDIGSGDEKRVSSSGGANRDELQKRLSAADQDEDEELSWDIDDE